MLLLLEPVEICVQVTADHSTMVPPKVEHAACI